ncbi:MAG: transporter [Paenibacillaceae bacterium]|nr:transporter [Paenibacillaceae bacterium]
MAITAILIANVVQSLYPRVLGDFTDMLQNHRITEPLILRYSLYLLGIGVTYGVLLGVGQYTVMRMARLFEFSTRRKMFSHFTSLSENYYSKHGVGELLSYVMNDVSYLRDSLSQGIHQSANSVIIVVSAIIMMSISSIPFYLIACCIAPLIFIPWIVYLYGPVVKNRSRKVQESLAAMTKSAEEQFGGIRVTKKFAVEKIMRSRFAKAVDDIVDNQLKLVRMSSIFQAILPFFGSLSLITAIIFGGYLTIRGRITLGEFVSLTLYMRMIVNPLAQIGNVINTMQRAKASLERINQLLSIEPDIREVEKAKPLSAKPMDIHIRNLSFAYPDTTVESLHDINLTIEAGKTVGIVGKTGSGKTTLVKLLLRTYDSPEGTIWIGGMDIRGIQLDSLRSQIAYVPQDGFLFSTSIRDNIAFHNRQSSMTSIETAAQQAKVYDNIMEFPERFETRLGERGITLSGGQRQRTSLARGFIKDSPILILDDSVSAVDAVTETEIIGNLRHGRKDKTTIIIAHRISALMHADHIVVLDEGQIVERGTHQQLLAGGGIYASLYAIQEGGTHHGHAGNAGIQIHAR